jgi:MazG family protein
VRGRREGLAEALLDLNQLAERLRRECPWDRAQTTRTIVPHTIEEAYEVADAALAGDDAKLVDELGDLLFQAILLALILEERGAGDLEQATRAIHAKLVRRHPHVFATAAGLESAGDVKERWERLKAAQEEREGIFHDVPATLPALLHARKAQRRAATVGFDWQDAAGPLAKLREEVSELEVELGRAPPSRPESEPDERVANEVGDVLFSVVNVARQLNVDPELALRSTTQRFICRVERAAELASQNGRDWRELDIAEQDRYFALAKEDE